MRKSWDEYFMDEAELASTRSTCLGLNVGAVIVKDHRILTKGFNGVPSGCEHCTDKGYCYQLSANCLTSDYPSKAIHAEINAIAQGAKYGIALNDTTLYCTHSPCNNCLKAIIATGISRIVYHHPFEMSDKNKHLQHLLLTETGVTLECL